MYRKIFMELTAPLIVPLRPELFEAAMHFLGEVLPIDSDKRAQYREAAQKFFSLDSDSVDELPCFIGGYFKGSLFGEGGDINGLRLKIVPDEGTWGDLYKDDLQALAQFIQYFGGGEQLPTLLHSVVVDTDTSSAYGEKLTSEFVELSLEGARIYRQESNSTHFWAAGRDCQNGTGFMATQLNDANMSELQPTSEKKFDL